MINPYNGEGGIGNSPGNIIVEILDNTIVLSVDSDSNGGIDIEQKIHVN